MSFAVKQELAKKLLEQNPELLQILFDNLQVNGPAGDQVAVIERTGAIDSNIAAIGARMGQKRILSLSSLVNDVMYNLDVQIMRPDPPHNQPISPTTIFEKPYQLFKIAEDAGVNPSGEMEKNKEEILAGNPSGALYR